MSILISNGTSITGADLSGVSVVTYSGSLAVNNTGTISSTHFTLRSYSGYYDYLNFLMRENQVSEVDADLYNKLGREPTFEEIHKEVLLRKTPLGKKLNEST